MLCYRLLWGQVPFSSSPKPVSKYVGAGGVEMSRPPFLGQATVSQWPHSEKKTSLSENLIFPSTPFPLPSLLFLHLHRELCQVERAWCGDLFFCS